MKKMVCINCPSGCSLEVEEKDGKLQITGNRCPRGLAYAETEYRDPRRIVTAAVRCTDGKVLPVRTDKALPQAHINMLLNEILHKTFPPFDPGEKLIENIAGTGVDLIGS